MRRQFAPELAQTLDALLFASPSHRRRQRVADELATLERAQQDVVLHWAQVISQTHPELAWQVCARARAAFSREGELTVEQFADWVQAVLAEQDAHDVNGRMGQAAGSAAVRSVVLDDLEGFLAHRSDTDRLDHGDVARRLSVFVAGISGGAMRVQGGGERTWTDGETLYVPAFVRTDRSHAPHRRYCALAALACVQWTSGGLSPDIEAALSIATEGNGDVPAWFVALEEIRLAAQLAREWPGLASALPVTELAGGAGTTLQSALAGPLDSLALAVRLAAEAQGAPKAGLLHIDFAAVRATRAKSAGQFPDLYRQPNLFRAQGQAASRPDQGGQSLDITMASADEAAETGISAPPGEAAPVQERHAEAPPPESAQGNLRPAGAGRWQGTTGASAEPVGELSNDADARYDEWDYRRGAYRKDWCHVFDREAPEGDAVWVTATRDKHARLIAQIRRRFESLRGEERWARRQREGSEIDLDAVVDALSEYRAGALSGARSGVLSDSLCGHGGEIDPRLFMERQRSERSLAVMFMVDMSGSTQGWVNEAEREALVMLCEALEAVGDRYAIYGFSGWTHRRCDLYRIKTFDEQYDQAVRRRIAGIEARDYTRMGPAIRHLTAMLGRQPERHKLLVTLSDGRPDDFGDEYRGRYGIEDTRRALHEARRRGVRSYCVTVDRHAADYLPQLYGSSHYSVLADARALPLRIAQVYRRLVS